MTELVTITPIPKLSQSMYETMACPASYQAQFIHGIQSPPNEFSELGTEAHACMSIYVNHLRDTDKAEDWAFFEQTLRTFSAEAQRILTGFIGSMKFVPQTILNTEVRFTEFEDAAGTPDLITMESPVDATIWDWKNYFDMIDADTFQSKLYPLLLFRQNPRLETVRFALVFMRYGRVRDVIWTRSQVPFLEKTLGDARSRQREIHQVEGLARAVPSKACDYCPLLRSAECQVNSMNPYAAMTSEERLSYVLFLRSALNANRTILREAASFREVTTTDANGRVYQASYVPSEKRTLPLLAAFPILRDHFDTFGEDLTPKVNISKTSLSALRKAKKRVLLDQALTDVEIVKEGTTFKISKINPEAADEEYETIER